MTLKAASKCPHCNALGHHPVSKNGPHLQVRCSHCGHWIKNARKHDVQSRPDADHRSLCEADPNETLKSYCTRTLASAKARGTYVLGEFNGTVFTVSSTDTVVSAAGRWHSNHRRRVAAESAPPPKRIHPSDLAVLAAAVMLGPGDHSDEELRSAIDTARRMAEIANESEVATR